MPTTNTLLESEYATAQLDVTERARLEELESIVEKGLQTFYEVGKALDEIREQKLYWESHKSFDAYCLEKWGIAKQTAKRFIAAPQVIENLTPMGVKIPANERQVRPLTGLSPELQLEIWQETLESSPNGIPSGAAVQPLVEQRFRSLGSGRPGQDGASVWEKLRADQQRVREGQRLALLVQTRSNDGDPVVEPPEIAGGQVMQCPFDRLINFSLAEEIANVCEKNGCRNHKFW